MKKHFLLFTVIIALAASVYFTERAFLLYSHTPTAAPAALPETRTSPHVSIKIGELVYFTGIAANGSVVDAMRALQSSGNIIFTGKDYPGMGFFVESINGKKNVDGYYWILYVNGKKSQKGVSQTYISPDDAVEWRYESR